LVTALRFTLNGKPTVVADVDPHQSVLSWLRSEGLTGAKEGCAEGECGACAVALVGRDERGRAHYQAVNSCLLPLAALHGRALTTVEGVAAPDGTLHPVQRAMVDFAGSQCGYCTPGFVMSLFCEYYRPGRTAYDPEAISGNLCRCTGYRPIADAARSLALPEASDPRVTALERAASAPLGLDYEPLGLDYERLGVRFLRPATLTELFDAWAAAPDAQLIAGGTDSMVSRNQRFERIPTLISLEMLAELSGIEVLENEIVIGAGVTLTALEAKLARVPAFGAGLHQLLPLFSSRLIRNRATLGGNLATASPIGDAAPLLLSLAAELTLASRAATRRVALSDFFLGYRKTALAKGELIQRVHLPLPLPKFQRFYKVSKRVLDDISAVAAAFALDVDERGHVERLNLAFGGMAATPIRAAELERAAQGRRWSADTATWLAGELDHIGTPLGDHRASAAYRRAMPGKLLTKFFEETAAGLEVAP
jgi:xanthine dehydrogenase small subunit